LRRGTVGFCAAAEAVQNDGLGEERQPKAIGLLKRNGKWSKKYIVATSPIVQKATMIQNSRSIAVVPTDRVFETASSPLIGMEAPPYRCGNVTRLISI
jgi:hypothetical protein